MSGCDSLGAAGAARAHSATESRRARTARKAAAAAAAASAWLCSPSGRFRLAAASTVATRAPNERRRSIKFNEPPPTGSRWAPLWPPLPGSALTFGPRCLLLRPLGPLGSGELLIGRAEPGSSGRQLACSPARWPGRLEVPVSRLLSQVRGPSVGPERGSASQRARPQYKRPNWRHLPAHQSGDCLGQVECEPFAERPHFAQSGAEKSPKLRANGGQSNP